MVSGAGTLRIEYAWGSRTGASLGATQRADPGFPCRPADRDDSCPSSDPSKICTRSLFGIRPSGGRDTAILVPSKGENHFETGKRSLSVPIRIGYTRGRDAADVPITMVFANHQLERFTVVTEETNVNGENNAQVQRAVRPRLRRRSELSSVEVRSLASRSCLWSIRQNRVSGYKDGPSRS